VTSPKKVNLALQGGGAHGAFVWGVLDELLEDGRLSIAAISATSAGAMNAVVFAYGMAVGGPKAARSKLEEFWRSVSRMERLFGLAWSPFDRLAQAFGLPPEYHPSHAAIHAATHIVPPNLLNPLKYNPLKDLLLKAVDFKRLNKSPQAVHLFLNATNVRTGKIKVFETPSITVDAVLASACLPPYFQAVEIDGEHYWDGGYLGNPALYPLRDQLQFLADAGNARGRIHDQADRRSGTRRGQAPPHVHALDRQRPDHGATGRGDPIASGLEIAEPAARGRADNGQAVARGKRGPRRLPLHHRSRRNVSLNGAARSHPRKD